MFHQELCEKKYQQDLCHLRWLEGSKSQIDPSSRSADLFTCNKYQPQYKNRKAIEKPVKIKQPDIINECDDHHKDNSDHDPQYLTALIYLLGTSYNKYSNYR